jgi:hypothetical protein
LNGYPSNRICGGKYGWSRAINEARNLKEASDVTLDTVTPEEYTPQTGEVDLTEISLTTALPACTDRIKGTIKHNYTHIYEQILRELGVTHRKTHPLRLAEIGVACGASFADVGELFAGCND